MEKIKRILTVSVLALFLAGGFVLHLLLPDGELSKAERRKLLQFPAVTKEALLTGAYATDLEEYLLDQFPGRDGFRTVKSFWTYYILGQKENNGIVIGRDPFSKQDTVAKLEPELDEKQVKLFAEKFAALRQMYFPQADVNVVVIPDKMYYLQSEGYPAMDYDRMLTLLEEEMPWADVRRNLFSSLISDSYYTTDSHWRQEKLQWVLEDLEDILQVELPDVSVFFPYYGT